MLEASPHTRLGSLDGAEMSTDLPFEVRRVLRRDIAMHGALEIPIEVLVRVQFRRVRRQVEQGDLVAVRVDPFSHRLGLVDAEVVENQEDLAPGIADESLHEDNQQGGQHGAVSHHEADLSLVGDRGDQRLTLAARGNPQHRRPSARRAAAVTRLVAAKPDLVTSGRMASSFAAGVGFLRGMGAPEHRHGRHRLNLQVQHPGFCRVVAWKNRNGITDTCRLSSGR